jgi:hypothetical protein
VAFKNSAFKESAIRKLTSEKPTTGNLRLLLAACLISAAPIHATFAAGGGGGGHGAGTSGHNGIPVNTIGGPTETTSTANKVTNYFTPPAVTSLATPFINSSQTPATVSTTQTQPTTSNNTTPNSTPPNNAPQDNTAPGDNAQAPSNSNVASEQNATTGATSTAPENVHVGHAANGLPIGSRGSGPGSPEQPIDSGTR